MIWKLISMLPVLICTVLGSSVRKRDTCRCGKACEKNVEGPIQANGTFYTKCVLDLINQKVKDLMTMENDPRVVLRDWMNVEGEAGMEWHQAGTGQMGLRFLLKDYLQTPELSYGLALNDQDMKIAKDKITKRMYELPPNDEVKELMQKTEDIMRKATILDTWYRLQICGNLEEHKKKNFYQSVLQNYEEHFVTKHAKKRFITSLKDKKLEDIAATDSDKIFTNVMRKFDEKNPHRIAFIRILWSPLCGIDHEFSMIVTEKYVQIYSAWMNKFTIPTFLEQTYTGQRFYRKDFPFFQAISNLFKEFIKLDEFNVNSFQSSLYQSYEKKTVENYWKNIQMIVQELKFSPQLNIAQ